MCRLHTPFLIHYLFYVNLPRIQSTPINCDNAMWTWFRSILSFYKDVKLGFPHKEPDALGIMKILFPFSWTPKCQREFDIFVSHNPPFNHLFTDLKSSHVNRTALSHLKTSLIAAVQARVRLMSAVALIWAGLATEILQQRNVLNTARPLIRGLLQSPRIRPNASTGKKGYSL